VVLQSGCWVVALLPREPREPRQQRRNPKPLLLLLLNEVYCRTCWMTGAWPAFHVGGLLPFYPSRYKTIPHPPFPTLRPWWVELLTLSQLSLRRAREERHQALREKCWRESRSPRTPGCVWTASGFGFFASRVTRLHLPKRHMRTRSIRHRFAVALVDSRECVHERLVT
jgi:hypothetical protein